MMSTTAARRGRWAFGLTAVAVAWGVALIAAALVVPVYEGETVGSAGTAHTSATLVAENGTWVLAIVALPTALALVVWLALRRKCAHGSDRAGTVAWLLVGLLGAFCLLGALSIGVFVLPVALALAGATALTPRGAA